MEELRRSRIDGLTIPQLQERYNLKRTSIYSQRFTPLGIVPKREGKYTYVDSEQLELLDRFDACLKRCASMDLCLKELGINSLGSALDLPRSAEKSSKVVHSLVTCSPEETLTRLERISRIAEFEFILPTSVVAWMFGLSPRTILGKGHEFSRGGFTFVRKGKFGREVGWVISLWS